MMERSDPSPEMAIAIIVILIIAFVIGFYVQVKKIKRVKQEKNVTWELEIYHSVVCIIYFSFSIFVEIVEQLVSDTSDSTNLVLCTFSWCIKTWGVTAILLHSLSISVSKYIVIVHCKGMRSTANMRQKTEKLIVFAIVAYPLVWTLLGWISKGGIPVSNQEFVSSSISMCSGLDWNNPSWNKVTNPKRSLFCGFIESDNQNGSWDFILIGSEIFCVIQSTITLIVNLNILEAFLYINIFRSMNRQVDPEQNKSMAGSQSKKAQLDNMRVVRVNAQVTAMVSVCEIFGFLIIAAISLSLNSATAGDILFPLLQNIILPYAFLMNTRENKYRIVDQGWIHVLRNTLNISSMCPGCSSRDDVEPINDRENEVKSTIYVVSRNVQQMPFIIATSSARNNNPSDCNINVPKNVQPGTSSLFVPTDFQDKSYHAPTRPTLFKRENSIGDVEKIPMGRKELIHRLLSNIDKETAYVRIFTQLVNLEQGYSFEKEGLAGLSMAQEEMVMETVSKLLSKGDRQHRAYMRKGALQRLQSHQKTEPEYQECFDEFVNMEEQFIDDVE